MDAHQHNIPRPWGLARIEPRRTTFNMHVHEHYCCCCCRKHARFVGTMRRKHDSGLPTPGGSSVLLLCTMFHSLHKSYGRSLPIPLSPHFTTTLVWATDLCFLSSTTIDNPHGPAWPTCIDVKCKLNSSYYNLFCIW